MRGRADNSVMLTVEEAAQLLRISRNLAYELVAQGELPHLRLGKRIVIPRDGLMSWIERQSGLPTPHSDRVSLPLPRQYH